MIATPSRRSFRFSLRTLFVAVTVFACWLGWNLHEMRERDAMLELMVSRNARFDSDAELDRILPALMRSWTPLQSGRQLPITWQVLGGKPVRHIGIFRDRFSKDEVARIQRLFPEADIAAVYFTGSR
jgi:hypothetical protein